MPRRVPGALMECGDTGAPIRGTVGWPPVPALSVFRNGGPHMLGFKVVFLGCPTMEVFACPPGAAMLWPYRAPIISL